MLTQIANRSKSANHAAEYLADVKQRFPRALELQCVPTDPELWKIENYELFLEERRKLLAAGLNEFLQNITATEDTKSPVTLDDLIADGESDALEFKSSLRWDLKEGCINRKLEEVVLKTIAAFANSQGGTLLIGVADDGTVLGLDSDYRTLEEASRDKFELHLRNLCKASFGVAFSAGKISISFQQRDDKDVCQVIVAPAREPVIVAVKDKNGQSVERFYVRSGNSSQEISLSEMNPYLKERFV